MTKIPPVPIKVMQDKFYLRELLLFFMEKRQTVILDVDFVFSVEEFKKFIAKNKLSQEMFDRTSFYNIGVALDYLRNMDRRDIDGNILNPPIPLLNYIPGKKRNGYMVQNSRTEYLENAKDYIEKFLSPTKTKNNIPTSDLGIINQTNAVSFKLRNGSLTLNKNTGLVKLNDTEKELNPKGKEFKVLLKLVTGSDGQATYTDLLGEGNVSKTNRRLLTFTIRNLKVELGILPKNNQKNRDIIHNVSGVGYRIK